MVGLLANSRPPPPNRAFLMTHYHRRLHGRRLLLCSAPGLSVSPDGKYLLYVQLDEARSGLMMAENFH
jgi:hypothetical protein